MAIKITLKNSVVQDSVPTTTHLPAVGELALNANINSLGIYMRASDNTIVKMAGPGSLTTPAASTTVAGISEYATNTETTTGTATDRTVTPAGLAAVTSAERSTSNSAYLGLAGGTLTGSLLVTNGSASTNSISASGDANTGLNFGTDIVNVATAGSNRLTVNADGDVLVATTTTPSADIKLLVAGNAGVSSGSYLSFRADYGNATEPASHAIKYDSSLTGLRVYGYGGVAFDTGGNESARVDSSGRLLVGHSSSVDQNAKVQASTTSTDTFAGFKYGANNAPNIIRLGKSRNASVGSNTILQDDDEIGRINFVGADGTDFNDCASIQCFVDGTPSDGTDMPGRLELRTSADGSATPTTRLTITSAGLVNVPDNGKFTAGASSDLSIYHDGTNSHLNNSTGYLVVGTDSYALKSQNLNEFYIKALKDGAVEIYYANTKSFETTSTGAKVNGSKLDVINTAGAGDAQLYLEAGEGGTAYIQFIADNGDDNTDKSRILQGDGGNLKIQNYDSGSWATKLETTSYGVAFVDEAKFDNDTNAGRDVIWDPANDQMRWLDNTIAAFGTGSDLQIYHDNSHSYIAETGTGRLHINTSELRVNNAADNEILISATENGAVELYYDNSKKLETTSGGVAIDGDLKLADGSIDNALNWGKAANILQARDGTKVTFGNANDLQIYHDGSHSYLTNSTGILHIRGQGSGIRLQKSDGEPMIYAIPDGAVELYYDNSKKFETYTSGIRATGNIVTLTGNISCASDSQKINAGASDDLQIYHNGSNSFIENDTGLLFLRAKAGENSINCNPNGAVSLYYDSSKKFETNSEGIQIHGKTYAEGDIDMPDNAKLLIGNSDDLQIYHNGTQSFIKNSTGGTRVLADDFAVNNLANNETIFQAVADGSCDLYHNGSIKLATTSTGIAVTGQCAVTSHVAIPDANASGSGYIGKVVLGADDDFQLFHNGTNNYIYATSPLWVQNNSIELQTQGGEKYVTCTANGVVELYYDNTKQFSTHANGPYTESGVGLRCGSSGPVSSELFTVQRNTGQVAYFDHSGGDDHIVIQCRHRGAYSTVYRTQMSFIDGAGDEVGTIKSHGTSTQYNTTSDYRLKENEVLISDGITRLKTLKPYRFNFKKTPENTVDGFFAHEVTAVPEAIAGEKDGTKSQGLDYSKLTPLLTAALQEAITKIETLETKVAALEGA